MYRTAYKVSTGIYMPLLVFLLLIVHPIPIFGFGLWSTLLSIRMKQKLPPTPEMQCRELVLHDRGRNKRVRNPIKHPVERIEHLRESGLTDEGPLIEVRGVNQPWVRQRFFLLLPGHGTGRRGKTRVRHGSYSMLVDTILIVTLMDIPCGSSMLFIGRNRCRQRQTVS